MKKQDALKEIILKKKERIILAKQNIPEEELKARIAALAPTRPFTKSINKANAISLVAEIKRASPSCGVIRQDFNPQEIARIYQEAGAGAISVLTEEDFFCGSVGYINEVKSAVSLPVLRKDFIIEPYQIYESRAFGADAILLIADLLSKEKLTEFLGLASELGLECLIEAHTEKELKKILSLKAPLIGINNRDLQSLEVDPKTIERLFLLIPKDKVVVAESGIKSHQDVLFLKILGVKAVLIGQAFMQAQDIAEKIQEIMGW
jgi:indole-3-glycerol phosphate synthase